MQELGYNGYERLRRGFDRAFGGRDSVPLFKQVVDAGCGTGLVGEQVRNVLRASKEQKYDPLDLMSSSILIV